MVDKNKLRGAIARSGYTQLTFARRIGMSKNTLNAKINGRSPITTDEAKRMCRELGIDDEREKVDIFLA